MPRILNTTELRHEICYSEIVECHRQTWQNGSTWSGYEHTPRFADGLMLVCSDVLAVFTAADGSTLRATKGDFIYVPEGIRYRVEFFGGGHGTDLYTVNFRFKSASGDPLRFGERITRIAKGASPECYTRMARLTDLCLFPDENKLLKQSELFALFDTIGEEIIHHSEDYYPIRKGARLLASEWNQNRPIAYYAAACEISETGFYQHFKAWAGISPADYRTKMRISAAKSLLRNSSYQISEIAVQIGFEDPYYFSRIFKKSVGMSPRAYRKAEEVTE